MSTEKNIYIVDVARSDTAHISVKVAAGSISTAKAYVARTMITARMAKPSELLGIAPNSVVDADTGLPLGIAQGTIQDAAQQLAGGDTAVGGTD